MPPINVLMKPSSGICNMRCDYCFYCDEAEKRVQRCFGFMSERTLKNVIRKTLLRAEGAISFAYQGGEPTLRGLDFYRQAVTYQKQYNKNGISVYNAFQTNGYLIDKKWCEFFRDHGFLVGVSIDGTKEIHDAYRHHKSGHPTYEKVVEATKLMDQYHVNYNILTVVNSRIAENISDVYRSYREHGWNYQQYIACLDPLNEEHGKNEYALTPGQYGEFLVTLFDLWYEDIQKGQQPYIRQFDNYLGILAGYQPESCEQRGCCGMQNVVEADGSVYPCDFYMIDGYCIGNFNEDRLESVDRHREEIQFIEKSKKLSKDCIDCLYYNVCRGGCQRHRDFDKQNGTYKNYFCSSYQFFFGQCLERMKELANDMFKDNCCFGRYAAG